MSKEFLSNLIPGPIVLVIVILLIKTPLTQAGLALATVVTTYLRFSANLAGSNDTLPIIVWILPLASFLY